jgi:hypothetical protein
MWPKFIDIRKATVSSFLDQLVFVKHFISLYPVWPVRILSQKTRQISECKREEAIWRGNFPVLIGNDARFPRIIGKFTLQVITPIYIYTLGHLLCVWDFGYQTVFQRICQNCILKILINLMDIQYMNSRCSHDYTVKKITDLFISISVADS